MSKKKEELTKTDMMQESAVEAISKSEEYLRNNRKTIIILVVALIVIIGAILAYNNLYEKPRQVNAHEAMFKAEQYFGKDQFELALDGNGADVQGFLQVIKQYKGTDAANLAHAYAGICQARLGQYDEALSHLKKFKAKDIMLAPAIEAAMGDCYVELDQPAEAVKHFEAAAKSADNDLLSPIFLKKAGLAYEAMGDNEKAMKSYQTIIDKYYNSPEYADAQKMIQALQLKK